MTLVLQFVRILEDSGEAAFMCLSSSLLHSKLMLGGRAFPGPEAFGPKHGRAGWVTAMTAKLGLLDIQGSDRSGRGAHPGSPCTISNKMPRGIPWTARLCLQPATPPSTADCSAVPDPASSPSKQGLHCIVEQCGGLYVHDVVFEKLIMPFPTQEQLQHAGCLYAKCSVG